MTHQAHALDIGPTSIAFNQRRQRFEDDMVTALHGLYGQRDDIVDTVARVFRALRQADASRSSELKRLDHLRSTQNNWFQQPSMVGYTCYVDRFAGDFSGIIRRISYLKKLGITYLHLLPLLKSREGENDGNFAIADYYQTNPLYGSMDDLQNLTEKLREEGISLCIDLVCNHTSDDHKWAKAARLGDARYQQYYHFFDNRELPDQFEQDLSQVFAKTAPGNFTYLGEPDKWVWTTFHPYQWDLNYKNPDVFIEMLQIILFLANQGVEIFRLDAVPFLWKRLGTNCQNQPEVHLIIRALRAAMAMAAPAVLLKAEAIVPSDQLVHYLGSPEYKGKECHLAYNTTLMTLLWGAVATADVKRLRSVLLSLPPIADDCSWLTYVRCHDEIGWNVLKGETGVDTAQGWSQYIHQVQSFFTGQTPGSFACGEAYQNTENHMDHGINGTSASLCGLEKALADNDTQQIKRSCDRLFLLYAIIFAYGGIPLLNMGDEIGVLNDNEYQNSKDYDGDGRWLQRVQMPWSQTDMDGPASPLAKALFLRFCNLIEIRKTTKALVGSQAKILACDEPEILILYHKNAGGEFILVANFSDKSKTISIPLSGRTVTDRLSQSRILPDNIQLAPYAVLWLQPDETPDGN